ncbi:50S ribosomal protein L18e [Candidatus Woesearchaeota archaeon]|nr:MAG: 50S ribosomal protein L18e [Candidatus Woesearchaeota archaeon]
MKKIQKNEHLVEVIKEMKKLAIESNIAFWKRIAVELEKPSRNKRVVNLGRINLYTKDGETIIVPGKVLGSGELDHKVTVCAYAFSAEAEKKITEKGRVLSLPELMKENPKASNVRIIG